MTTHFFHTQNASRPYRAGGSVIRFQAYGVLGGALLGVFQAKDDKESAHLMMLALDPSSGVTEMREMEYRAIVGKQPKQISDQSITTKFQTNITDWKEALEDYPSFQQQTRFESGLFDLRPSQLATDFNCTIAKIGQQLTLVTRRSVRAGRLWNSSFMAYPVDSDCGIGPGVPIKIPNYSGDVTEQVEDPRLVVHEDKLLLSYCIWNRHGYYPRQMVSVFDHSWNHLDRWIIPYGANALQKGGAEKNWVFFNHNGKWRLVYRFQPHTVCTVEKNAVGKIAVTETHATTIPNFRWSHGEVRGGTPPVKQGGHYVSFFHSSLPWSNRQKRYFMGAYCFEAKPPFRITHVSGQPILGGSIRDTRILGGPLVIFPCGAVLQKDHWLVVFGVNDEACGWIKIPKEHILEK